MLVAILHNRPPMEPTKTEKLGTGLLPARESMDGCDGVSSSKEVKSGLEAQVFVDVGGGGVRSNDTRYPSAPGPTAMPSARQKSPGSTTRGRCFVHSARF